MQSPVLLANKGDLLAADQLHDVSLTIGVKFSADQVNDQGWFVDTDRLDQQLEEIVLLLSSKKWTELFDFRPTFELVSKYAYEQLTSSINQLAYVELSSETFRSKTRYSN